jgi:leucine dehydrogenase
MHWPVFIGEVEFRNLGGKGVICRNSGKGLMPEDSSKDRQVVYEEYGRFLTSLHGCYVSAEDAG